MTDTHARDGCAHSGPSCRLPAAISLATYPGIASKDGRVPVELAPVGRCNIRLSLLCLKPWRHTVSSAAYCAHKCSVLTCCACCCVVCLRRCAGALCLARSVVQLARRCPGPLLGCVSFGVKLHTHNTWARRGFCADPSQILLRAIRRTCRVRHTQGCLWTSPLCSGIDLAATVCRSASSCVRT